MKNRKIRIIRKITVALAAIITVASLLTGCGDKKTQLIPKLTEVKFDIDYPVGQVTRDVVVCQSFISNCDQINDIMLYGATYTRENTATIYVELLKGNRENNEQIAKWTIDSSKMEDNEVITLSISDDNVYYNETLNTGLSGQNMLIRISSPDGEPELSPTFWMTEENVYEDGCLNIAGYDQYNDLWFQVEGY